MKCPRCQAVFSAAPDSAGTVVCTSCGVRLRTRGPAAEAPAPRPAAAPRPATAPRRETGPALARVAPGPKTAADEASRPAEARPATEAALAEALRQVLAEIRAVRKTQERILGLLQEDEDVASRSFFEESMYAPAAAPATPVRTRKRKSVLIIDDDDATRQEAVAAFQAAEVPVHSVSDGNAGLAAIAGERPDVIVLELAMAGSMGGKDVVNMIKATMEWVDIPLVLYTRLPIGSQKEARQIHGADEIVNKSATGVESLVLRVIALFRRT